MMISADDCTGGYMGGGIAQALLHKRIPVHIKDISDTALLQTRVRIEKLFEGTLSRVCQSSLTLPN